MGAYTHDTSAEEVATDCHAQIANKTILVTGVSPVGLGAAFVAVVAKHAPACLILAARDVAKAEATAREVAAVAPQVRTRCIALDLASLEQVRTAAAEINSLEEQIDIIVNNAGVMATPYSKTVDGIELQFAANHIGHFLLTNLLLPKILARKTPVRVVNVSSNGWRLSPVRFEDWNFVDGEVYNPWYSYGQSKTANMLFSVSLSRKLGNRNLTSVSIHPGLIRTRLSKDLGMDDWKGLRAIDASLGNRSFWEKSLPVKTPVQGVATHVFAAFHPNLDSPEANGSYLENSRIQELEKINSWARDEIEAEKLWKLSEKLVSQEFSFGP